ncbi:MAG: tyrosine-type recombinase/integrase [Methylophaga sp.]
MRHTKLLKGLTKNNGTWAYVRSVPKQLREHPTFEGKANYRRQLLPVSCSEDLLIKAWRQAHDDFEQYIESLKQINLPVIEKNELIKKAEVFLRVNGLSSGMLEADKASENRYQSSALQLMVEHSGIFDELAEYSSKENYNQANNIEFTETAELPEHLKIQHQAWKLLSQPSKNNQIQYLYSDCWTAYAAKKGLDDNKREDKRIKTIFTRFINVVGDQVLEAISVNQALQQYVEAREYERQTNIANKEKPSPSPSSIGRELNTIQAVLRTGIRKHHLNINIQRPELRQDQKAKERHTFNGDEQIALLALVSDTSRADYQPYKELLILLMVQTGTHISELMRLKRDRVKLDHAIPHIILDGDLKTSQRKRVLPIVFNVQRIRDLAQLFEDGSYHFFGAENYQRSTDTYSAQLNSLCKQVNKAATSYSLRHAFKHTAYVRGIDAQTMAILGGWSGKDLGLSKQMQGYAASGLLNQDSLKTLQEAMLLINAHLIQETQPEPQKPSLKRSEMRSDRILYAVQ